MSFFVWDGRGRLGATGGLMAGDGGRVTGNGLKRYAARHFYNRSLRSLAGSAGMGEGVLSLV